MKTKDQMDFIVMELHTGQQFWWIGGPDDDSEGKCVWWHSNQDVETFLGAEDILDHNLKETFNVNVVALTTWVSYDCCADIPYSEDIHESHYICQQDIQSAKD